MTGPARTWLTVATAARATGRSVRTIQRWIRDGRLDTVHVLGTTRVNELQLLRVERDTRNAARAGRPGARPPIAQLADVLGLDEDVHQVFDLARSGVVLSRQRGAPTPTRPT